MSLTRSGSGTTMEVAEAMGRYSAGMNLNPDSLSLLRRAPHIQSLLGML